MERCFGVLQARFAIIRNPCRQWGMQGISDIMFACCILHNMILDDESGVQGLENVLEVAFDDNVPMERGLTFEQLLEDTEEIENEPLGAKGHPLVGEEDRKNDVGKVGRRLISTCEPTLGKNPIE